MILPDFLLLVGLAGK